ncbi:MAG: hypothetical protein WCJ03_02575 [Bacteroidales bacterium]|jgi:hypothetical protein
MEQISSTSELKNAIQLLEISRAIKADQLKEEFYLVYESLKPANLLKNTINEVVSSPYLIDNILGAALGLATGYLSKKMVVGKSINIIRQLVGTLMQVGVTSAISQNVISIKSYAETLFQQFFHKKK